MKNKNVVCVDDSGHGGDWSGWLGALYANKIYNNIQYKLTLYWWIVASCIVARGGVQRR